MRIIALLLFFTLHFSVAHAAVGLPSAEAQTTQTVTAAELTHASVEAKMGRKLKFKERVALSVARGKLKRAERRAAKGKPPRGSTDGLAIASFVCGILGLFLFFPAIPALVLGIISLGRYNRGEYYTGKGLAITGVVLGGLMVFLFLLLVGLFAIIFAAA